MVKRIRQDRRRGFRAVACAGMLVAAACSGLNDPVAGYDNAFYTSTLFAINGTPLGSPTAINTANSLTVRAEVGYEFDVAFDLDPSGRPVIFTQRAVGLPQNAVGHAVALQPLTGAFESILDAPSSGWVADSSLTVVVGQAFAVRASSTVCQLYASPYLYTKAVVDSVNTSSRRLWLTVVTDPNCGFRSFIAGRPTH